MSAKKISTPTKKAPTSPLGAFIRKCLPVVTGWLCLLVSISFFTGTYDTAQVKLTLLHTGATVLLGLWAALKIAEWKSPFTRQNFPFLFPICAYLGWNIISFICGPFHLESAEEFIRLLMYGGIMLLIAAEFTQKDIRTLTKFIIIAAWISFAYGALQIVDGFWPGADFLPWRGFFTRRIFSTHANPNFFGAFVVFASAVAGAQYLATRKKSLLVLLGLGLVELFFTESKGAWLAYGAAAAVGTFLFTNRIFPTKHIKKLNLAAAGVLLAALILAGTYTAKRFQSVSFRSFTWLAAFEMVQDSPVIGTGPGSFKIIYPAYKRPQIFYIENSHNTETQHAENEYLEQWATTGTVGLAIFLWLLAFVFICAWKNLQTASQLSAEERERVFYLLGYATALAGLMIHAFVDISLRFASSGLLFAVFIGVIIALSNPPQEDNSKEKIFFSAPWLLWVARLVLAGALAYGAWQVLGEFKEVSGSMSAGKLGDGFLICCAWTVLLGCILGVGYVYLRAAWTSRAARTGLLLAATVPGVVWFYGLFQANHYYSLGVRLVQMGNAEGALSYFTRAVKLNPLLTEYRQYRANTFATIFDLTTQYSPARGDMDKPSNDYERALTDFAWVLKYAPNHTALHQNTGQLYYAMALRASQEAAQAKSVDEFQRYSQIARDNMEQAKRAFKRSLALDPVNAETYLFLTSISLMERNPAQAQAWIDAYKRGPKGVTEEEFLEKNRHNPQINALEMQVQKITSSVRK